MFDQTNSTILGKLLGGLIGMSLAGPLGAVAGVILGHSIDAGITHNSQQKRSTDPQTPLAQKVFFEKTFAVLGFVAKSTGRVNERHIANARVVMAQLGLNEAKRREAIHWFNRGKALKLNECRSMCANLRRQLGGLSPFLRLFLDMQYNMATVDGSTVLAVNTEKALAIIWSTLGFNYHTWLLHQQQQSKSESAHAYHRPRQQSHQRYYTEDDATQKNYQHSSHSSSQQYSSNEYSHHNKTTTKLSLVEAYAILELQGHEETHDIKRAYRKLISLYHPDKLMAQGASNDQIKLATEKSQRLHTAYDIICRERAARQHT